MATHYFSLRGRVQILSHSCVEHAHTQARYLGTLFRMLLLLLVFPRLLCMVFLFFSCWSSCSRPMCHPAGPKAFNLVRATFLPLKPPRYWCLPVRDPGVNYSTLFTLHSGPLFFDFWLLPRLLSRRQNQRTAYFVNQSTVSLTNTKAANDSNHIIAICKKK